MKLTVQLRQSRLKRVLRFIAPKPLAIIAAGTGKAMGEGAAFQILTELLTDIGPGSVAVTLATSEKAIRLTGRPKRLPLRTASLFLP